MGKMEEALRSEIGRLARKELRETVGPLSKEVRELKRAVARLSKIVNALEKNAAQRTRLGLGAQAQLRAPADEVKAARLSARVIKNVRKKLGISQGKMAALLDVSPASVAFWEQGRARPRGTNKNALVALRKLGRRDVKRILAEKGIPDSAKKSKKRRKKRSKK
jgi:DNA-binding transcriptional regulator YiaG